MAAADLALRLDVALRASDAQRVQYLLNKAGERTFSKADLTTTNLPLAVNAVRKAAFLPDEVREKARYLVKSWKAVVSAPEPPSTEGAAAAAAASASVAPVKRARSVSPPLPSKRAKPAFGKRELFKTEQNDKFSRKSSVPIARSARTVQRLFDLCVDKLVQDPSMLSNAQVSTAVLLPVFDRIHTKLLARLIQHQPVHIQGTQEMWRKHCKTEFPDMYRTLQTAPADWSEKKNDKFEQAMLEVKSKVKSAQREIPRAKTVVLKQTHTGIQGKGKHA